MVEMKKEFMVVRVLIEKMKREEEEKGFVFGIGIKGEEKRITVRHFL